MDITLQKLISSSSTTWEDSSLVMEDQIIHDHHSLFDPFWSSYGYENNHVQIQIPCSSTSPQQHQVGLTTTTPVLDSISIMNHHHHSQMEEEDEEEEEEELGAMKEMMFKIASMQPVDIDPTTLRKPKRRNVRISDDPQSVAARHRRERISEKIRILQRLVPGGTKMDTASMLDEAIRYVKFLKRQIRQLQSNQPQSIGIGILPMTFPSSTTNWGFSSIKPFSPSTGGNQVAATTTAVAAAIVGSSYNFGGGGDNQTMCLNNEVIHN